MPLASDERPVETPVPAALDARIKKNGAFRRLGRILETLGADPTGGLVAMGRWLRARGRVPGPDGGRSLDRDRRVARLRLLVRALETDPGLRDAVGAAIATTLAHSSAVRLFAQTGLPVDAGFVGEAVARFLGRLLPVARDDADLAEVLGDLFPKERDAELLTKAPADLVRALGQVLGRSDGRDPWAPLREAAEEAMALLATRVSALGLAEDVRARSPAGAPRASPFFRLPRAYDALGAARGGAEEAAAVAVCRALHAECRAVVAAVHQALETSGVSVDMVYRLDMIERCLERLEALVRILVPDEGTPDAVHAARFTAALARGRTSDRSVMGLVRANAQLLARKIVERAGHTGEHYITATRREWVGMLLSAAGGGVLTAGTTFVKLALGRFKLSFFLEGLAASLNYSASFVAMQLCGFTLATKQPSMTAAALAGAVGDAHEERLLALIARTVRSQLAAALGNIGMVVPAAIGVEYAHRRLRGGPVLDAAKAEYVLHSLDPLHSGTILWAVLTGAMLWASSLAAGWIENAAVYRRLPEGIAGHRLGRLVGRRTMGWVSRWFTRNVSGFGGNVTLGFLLGMTPVLGRFFGVPLDVRHVTLSTGALTFAVASGGRGTLAEPAFWHAALGIVAIGALNFGVSFVLALSVALRARGVTRVDRLRLLGRVARRFFRSPGEFFFPPRST